MKLRIRTSFTSGRPSGFAGKTTVQQLNPKKFHAASTDEENAFCANDSEQFAMKQLGWFLLFIALGCNKAPTVLSAATGIDRQLVRATWSTFKYQIALEDETRWAMSNKLTGQTIMPNYRDFTYQESLKAVQSEALGLDK